MNQKSKALIKRTEEGNDKVDLSEPRKDIESNGIQTWRLRAGKTLVVENKLKEWRIGSKKTAKEKEEKKNFKGVGKNTFKMRLDVQLCIQKTEQSSTQKNIKV